MSVPLCDECEYYGERTYDLPRCYHPESAREDPVHGAAHCTVARFSETFCGREGRAWKKRLSIVARLRRLTRDIFKKGEKQ